jgi:hypothetical protein
MRQRSLDTRQGWLLTIGAAVLTPTLLLAVLKLLDVILLAGSSRLSPNLLIAAAACLSVGFCLWPPIRPGAYCMTLVLCWPVVFSLYQHLFNRVEASNSLFVLVQIIVFVLAVAVAIASFVLAKVVRRFNYPDWVPMAVMIASLLMVLGGLVPSQLQAYERTAEVRRQMNEIRRAEKAYAAQSGSFTCNPDLLHVNGVTWDKYSGIWADRKLWVSGQAGGYRISMFCKEPQGSQSVEIGASFLPEYSPGPTLDTTLRRLSLF